LLEEYKLKEEAHNKLQEYETNEIEALKRIRTTTQVHKNSKFIFIFFLLFSLVLFSV
jgi:hypothetical protein